MSGQRLSCDIRRRFIEYFTLKHQHKFIKSSPVKPESGDTKLSYVGAGINQFRGKFFEDQDENFKRICSYQKCIRIGGKMCDLDNVGRDFRHHTFFEMLGNWSFYDYGREEACEWALDFLVNELRLNQDKITVTYFASEKETDLASRDVWLRLGLKSYQVLPNYTGDNWWEMSVAGPCGVSTEIFYPCGNELLELWNLVFIDRYRETRHYLEEEVTEQICKKLPLLPLKGKFVDTGLGLERLMAVLEGVQSNYDTDLFRDLIQVIEKRTSQKRYTGLLNDPVDIDYRILVDHCRMLTVALTDGVIPGRRGQGFDLRKIIKKSTLISRDTFAQETPRYLMFDVIDQVINILSPAYPELAQHVSYIRRVLAKETKRYLDYLERKDLEKSLPEMT